MTPIQFKAKNTANKLSQQVNEILTSKGLSKIFNDRDFDYFKSQIKSAFNRAQAIAEKFIEYHEGTKSDFNEYLF